MSLAYHILAHKNPDQLARLFKVLLHQDDLFVLHIDKRAPPALHAFGRELARTHANVVLQRPRVILWGGSQIPDVQIEAMNISLAHSNTWSHFINLSGQDFPLRPRAQIVDYLKSCPDTNFVVWFDPFERKIWPNIEERLSRRYLHWPWLNALFKLPGFGWRIRSALGFGAGGASMPYVPWYRRPRPDFFRYYGGSNHAILTRNGCDLLAHDQYAQRIRRWLASSAIPDESVFQSVLLNSKLADSVNSRNFRRIDMPIGTLHPRTFLSADYDFLAASPHFFARKFDETVDSVILDMIETNLLQTSQSRADVC